MSDARMPRVRLRDLFIGRALLSLFAGLANSERRSRHFNDAIAFARLASTTSPDAYTDDKYDTEPEEPAQTSWPYLEPRA